MLGSVLTVEECAIELKVSETDVLNLISKSELSAKTIGTELRIPICSFQKYLGFENPVYQKSVDDIVSEVQLISSHLSVTCRKATTKKLLSEVLSEVLELKSGFVSSNTYEWNKDLAKHIYTGFNNQFIGEITPKDIQQFYNTVAIKPNGGKISKRLMQGISNLLNTTFKYAVESDYLEASPITSSIRLPKSTTPDPHDRFMDYDEISTLLTAIKSSEKYSTIIKLLVMTGLRIGEALGLFWSDIDMNHCIIHVRHAIVREYYYDDKGKRQVRYIIGPTKTPESVRDIPVVPEVIKLLKNWKVYMQCQIKIFEEVKQNSNEHLIFPNKFGLIQNCNTFQYHFQNYLKRHGVEQLKVTFHRLRHSYGSFLLEQGEPLITVSRLLGHKNIRVTADTYCTITSRVKIAAVQKTKIIWESIV